jgi:hypothetical protein
MTDELTLTRVVILAADDVERSSSNSRPRHSRRLMRKLICWRFVQVLDIQAFRHAGLAPVLCGRYKQRPDRRLLSRDRARSTYPYSALSHSGSRCVPRIRPRGDLLLKTHQSTGG